MNAPLPTHEDAADRVELFYLAGGFSDASNLRDVERLVSLWTLDGVSEIPALDIRMVGADELRAGFQRRLDLWEVMLQTSHPAMVEVDGEDATGRVYVEQLARRAGDGAPLRATSVCDDRYRRINETWRFALRTWHFLFTHEETPVVGIGRPLPRLMTRSVPRFYRGLRHGDQ